MFSEVDTRCHRQTHRQHRCNFLSRHTADAVGSKKLHTIFPAFYSISLIIYNLYIGTHDYYINYFL